MAGTVTVAGIVAACLVLTTALAAGGAVAAAGQRVAAAADAAALAAADAASGAVGGEPCERAAELARAGDAELVDCTLDGLVATVTVAAEVLRFHATASARAGPPGRAD
ncbi:Rv3654c family TadE-like protein [Microbacterium sp. SORGH_AS_0888]|uniref:Rv3654c family TadE-like protein n=1 Tax=Microbacterium sp. SORGH_AS_0888 TaxID=3041791 RepID=UPI00278959A0|nr:Rv3654c family TadE-like protein [Microbacterium sp. SORGH_AS_0888]MDQ1130978.1 secretion/DNA translocation related TadE-like protein [Microbacterium sp. SORGH_AS_0888]